MKINLKNASAILAAIALVSLFALSACTDSMSKNANYSTSNSNTNGRNTAVVVNANSTNMNTANNAGGQTSEAVDGFWKKAAEGGMAEVELSKVALAKAQNADVKKFAEMMIADHGKANAELKALASKKTVSLPASLDPTHKMALEKLESMSGMGFDKAYVEAMVKDHSDAVNLFQTQADGGTDKELKDFAAKTLPTLKSHQKMIGDIQGKLK